MLAIPASVLLSWPAPNYIDPETRGNTLIVITCVSMALATPTVGLRFYSRMRVHGSLGLDDVFIAISLMFSLGLGTIVILGNIRYCWDRHIWDVQLKQYAGVAIMAFLSKLFYTLATTFIRISFICFYFRLIHNSGAKHYGRLLWASIALQVAVCITFVFLTIFACVPVDAYWDFEKVYTAKCTDEPIALLAGSCIGNICDFIVAVLPISIVMGLQMPLRHRIGVSMLLSMGFLVTIVSCVKTYYTWKASATFDLTWYTYPVWICGALEVNIAVLCACIPSLKPLFAPYVSKVYTMFRSLYSANHSSNSKQPQPENYCMSSKPSAAQEINARPRSASSTTSSQMEMLDISYVSTQENAQWSSRRVGGIYEIQVGFPSTSEGVDEEDQVRTGSGYVDEERGLRSVYNGSKASDMYAVSLN